MAAKYTLLLTETFVVTVGLIDEADSDVDLHIEMDHLTAVR